MSAEPNFFETVRAVLGDINQSFGKAVTKMEGWAGTLGVMYFSPGAIGSAIVGLCVMDLFTGTILSLKIQRIVKLQDGSQVFPELADIILKGEKEPFTWRRWGQWAEKMLVVFGLIVGGEWFKLYLEGNAWSATGGEFSIGVVYFVLLFTNFRSIVRNTALVTENSALLSVWKWMGGDSGLPTNLDFLHGHGSPAGPGSVTTTTVAAVIETTKVESEEK